MGRKRKLQLELDGVQSGWKAETSMTRKPGVDVYDQEPPNVYDQDLLSAMPSGVAVIRRPKPGQLNAKGLAV
jgi:hypothetical protein